MLNYYIFELKWLYGNEILTEHGITAARNSIEAVKNIINDDEPNFISLSLSLLEENAKSTTISEVEYEHIMAEM